MYLRGLKRSHDWIDGVIVGMNSIDQLHENLKHFNRPLLSESEMLYIESTALAIDDQTLNPSNWRKIC